MTIIPTRLDLINMFPNSVGAEIGVCKGWFSVEILNRSNVKKLYGVDAWEGQTPGEPEMTKEYHEGNYQEALLHLAGHLPGGRVELIRGRSDKIGHDWNREKLDWVYIDAAHDYASVMCDLRAWSGTLKCGGSILGHDYTENAMAKKYNFGVIAAVTNFCKEFGWELTALTNEDFASYRLDKII